MGFDFIMIVSLLVSQTSSLSLDMERLLVVGSTVVLLMVVQQLVALLVLSQEMSTCPSILPP